MAAEHATDFAKSSNLRKTRAKKSIFLPKFQKGRIEKSKVHKILEYLRYSLSVMFHVFPVVGWRENIMAVISKEVPHTSMGHVEKSGTHQLTCMGGEERTATHNNHNHITMC